MNHLSFIQEVRRCLKCHNPPCSSQCPHNVEPATIIRSIAFDNMQVVLGEVDACILCGECEHHCIRSKLDSSVRIVDIMRHLKEGGGLK